MKQLFLTTVGDLEVREVDPPALGPHGYLTQTLYSAVSAGTDVAQIRARQEKPAQSDIVMGNGNCGRILAAGSPDLPLGPGDLLAAASTSAAWHAENCHVPRTLGAGVPPDVPPREAAFVTQGCIALHGVRHAGIQVGETVAVLGQGFIGQMVAQFARLSGGRVITVDLHGWRAELSEELGAERAVDASRHDPAAEVRAFTDGDGADLVLICTTSEKNSEPWRQTVEMVRDQGKVVVIGAVEPNLSHTAFYNKELQVISSRAYGPGIYDRQYEAGEIDYPRSYVRWTVQRNMVEYLRLVSGGELRAAPLITHEFPFTEAARAYATIQDARERTLGVLLAY